MAGNRVVVDTTVWSLLLRRRSRDLSIRERQTALYLRELIVKAQVILLGVVRMELLSGIADQSTFGWMAEHLRDFDDIPPDVDDYVRAAAFSNSCRSAGIATSPIDMLICSVAAGRDLKILSTDKDFGLYSRQLPIQLVSPSEE